MVNRAVRLGIVAAPVRRRTDDPENLPLTLGLRLVGVAGKRGVIPRVPTADALLGDIEQWLRADAGATPIQLVRPSRTTASGGVRVLRVRLHPAAREVELTTGELGRVTAAATTAAVGPGYHTYVAQLLRRLGGDLSIAWDPPDPDLWTGDETGYFEAGRREDAERRLLAWLRDRLQVALDSRRRGDGPVFLGGQADHLYDAGAPLLTALGPRDERWLQRALADPRVAIDVWPWWSDATDGRYLLNRALVLMWNEVRWRPPVSNDERATVAEVLRLLRRAHGLDPSLSFPWREWRELLEHSGTMDTMMVRIAERAAAAGDGPLIGYRRHPVTIEHAGWRLTVPGSFAERRTDEEWWGGEGGRAITVAGTPTEADGRPMLPDAFLRRVAGHLGTDVLRHEAGPVVGAARLTVDAESGVEVAVLEGYSAIAGSGAAIRVEIHDPADWDWALGIWRSLRPAA